MLLLQGQIPKISHVGRYLQVLVRWMQLLLHRFDKEILGKTIGRAPPYICPDRETIDRGTGVRSNAAYQIGGVPGKFLLA